MSFAVTVAYQLFSVSVGMASVMGGVEGTPIGDMKGEGGGAENGEEEKGENEEGVMGYPVLIEGPVSGLEKEVA